MEHARTRLALKYISRTKLIGNLAPQSTIDALIRRTAARSICSDAHHSPSRKLVINDKSTRVLSVWLAISILGCSIAILKKQTRARARSTNTQKRFVLCAPGLYLGLQPFEAQSNTAQNQCTRPCVFRVLNSRQNSKSVELTERVVHE